MDPNSYFCRGGLPIVSDQIYWSHLSVPILNCLIGQPWDEVALALVVAHKPTRLRVTTGEVFTDSWSGRVTVYVDRQPKLIGVPATIEWIEQEVTLPMPRDLKNGHELMIYLEDRGVKISQP